MKLAVVGSRSFFNYKMLSDKLSKLEITEIVSGGAFGADYLAEQYAKEHKLPITVFKPDWDKYGKSAGYIRNKLIVDYAEQCIAFWDGKSKGTKNTIDLAKKEKKLYKIVLVEN
jgi:hypothetical protein